MDGSEQAEKLVQVHHSRDEWEGNIVVGYLRDNGIDATLRSPPAVPPLDAAENLSGSPTVNGVFVLEHEAQQARQLLQEFLSTATDQRILEETAAQTLKVDKETIGRLRGALREERRTFAFLAWVGVAFLGAATVLWAIWPSWLKVVPPPLGLRLVVLILLALAALYAGSWAGRQLK